MVRAVLKKISDSNSNHHINFHVGAMNSLKRNCACGKKGEVDAPMKTVDDAAETGHVSPRGAISPISHGPSASTMVKVEPSGAPAAIDANDL